MGTSKSYITPKTPEYTSTKRAFTNSIKEYKKNGTLSSVGAGRLLGNISNNFINENKKGMSFIPSFISLFSLINDIKEKSNNEWDKIKIGYPEHIRNLYSAIILNDSEAKDKLKESQIDFSEFATPVNFFTAIINENVNIDGINKGILLNSLNVTLEVFDIEKIDDFKDIDMEPFFKIYLTQIILESIVVRYYEEGLSKNMSHSEMEKYIKFLEEIIENSINNYSLDELQTNENMEKFLDDKISEIFNDYVKIGISK